MTIIKNISLAILFLVLFLCSVSYADKDVILEIIDYGTYTGKAETIDLNEPGTWIRGYPGISFGFRCLLRGVFENKKVPIVVRTTFPMIKDSEKVFYLSEYIQEVRPGKIFWEGYVFEDNRDVVAGDWTIQIFYDETKIGEQKFTVYTE